MNSNELMQHECAQPPRVWPNDADIKKACAELVWLHQASTARIASIAQQFLCVEPQFLAELKSQLSVHLDLVSQEDIDSLACAVITLARACASGPRHH